VLKAQYDVLKILGHAPGTIFKTSFKMVHILDGVLTYSLAYSEK